MRFHPVRLLAPQAEADCLIEIELGDGRRVHLPRRFDEGNLRRVLRVPEDLCHADANRIGAHLYGRRAGGVAAKLRRASAYHAHPDTPGSAQRACVRVPQSPIEHVVRPRFRRAIPSKLLWIVSEKCF